MKKLQRNMARIICCLLIVIAGIGAGTTQVEAAKNKVVDKGECGSDVTWRLYSNGTLEIKGSGEMVLGTNYWKGDLDDIKKVVVKKGVTSVAPFAFQNCRNLTSVTLEKSVETIGVCAFENCEKLKTITLSKGLLEIKDKAFQGCISLKKLTIPSSVKKIEDEIVQGCEKLTHVYIKGADTEMSVRSFVQGKDRTKKIYLHGDSRVKNYVKSIAIVYLKYSSES